MEKRLQSKLSEDIQDGKVVIVCIHGDLPLAVQTALSNKVNPVGIVIFLVTNTAETSLTLPIVRYVVDSGRARVGRWCAQLQMFILDACRCSSSAHAHNLQIWGSGRAQDKMRRSLASCSHAGEHSSSTRTLRSRRVLTNEVKRLKRGVQSQAQTISELCKENNAQAEALREMCAAPQCVNCGIAALSLGDSPSAAR